jgi:hypothetical protein
MRATLAPMTTASPAKRRLAGDLFIAASFPDLLSPQDRG